MRLLTGMILMALVSIGSGCAMTKDYVDLDYTPQPNVTKIEGADEVAVAVTLNDVRPTKDKVSCKKNGYGMEMASIISNNDVSKLFSDAITDELRNRGFSIKEGSVTITVELTKFYNDFKIGFWSGSASAEVACNIQVKKPDGSINYAKATIGAFRKTGVMLMTGENAKIALEGALKDAVAKLMQDESFIKSLLLVG